MAQPDPTQDPIAGLHFTFPSDRAEMNGGSGSSSVSGSASGSGPGPDSTAEAEEPSPLRMGETPLTDPRALGSSTVLHAILILAASLTVLNVSIPGTSETRSALRGELDPVDNRASKDSASGGGGSPGEIGGLGNIAFVAPAAGTDPQGPGLDPAADALLSEILPSTTQLPPEALQRALPGPQTTGIGLVPGTGAGGGGGSGGGSGGGVGRGVGPGTEFFGARETGRSFAYVIDCSGSMATRNSLEVAKRELLASLNQLPPDALFSVIFYNLKARVFSDPVGQEGMMAASAANKTRVQNQLQTVVPDGGTDHMMALRTALGLKPEVIFFLTDADLMTNNDVNEILAEAGKSRIQAVEFGRGADLGMETPLRRLATTTGGTYRYIDVTRFPRSPLGF
jgi:hypothetical protein